MRDREKETKKQRERKTKATEKASLRSKPCTCTSKDQDLPFVSEVKDLPHTTSKVSINISYIYKDIYTLPREFTRIL